MSERSADAPRNRRSSARGFTLIEVLAALVIVALGMLGVIEAVTQSARNGTYLREKTLAHWIALNVITEKRLQPEPPPVTESSGDVEFAHGRIRASGGCTGFLGARHGNRFLRHGDPYGRGRSARLERSRQVGWFR